MESVNSLTSPEKTVGHSAEQWHRLLSQLEVDAPVLADRIADNLLATVPGYDGVEKEALTDSVLRNIALSIRTILAGDNPSPADVPEARALAIERMAQGVPLGNVLSGFRTCMIEILRHLVAKAPDHGIPPGQMLEWSTLLWSLGDVFSTRATAVYRDHEIALAVADSVRRSEWIGNVVAEGVDAPEMLWGAAMYDVPTDVPIRALAVSVEPGGTEDMERRLDDWAQRGGVRVLSTVRSSVIVGIVVGDLKDDAPEPGVALGLGGPELLIDLPRSFSEASLALRSAEGLGMRGVVDIHSLSWRLAIQASPDVTQLLRQRYLEPLGESGAFAQDLVESVQAYLNHRMNIPAAARSIPVHVNTLRYRLRRFEELTGSDLVEVDTLIEVSWVLAAAGGGPGRG